MDDYKNKWVALALAIFLGAFGVHKFYLGRKTAGIFYLIFCWTGIPWLLSLVDALVLVFKGQKSFNAMYNPEKALDPLPSDAGRIRCPECREAIWADARKCRHCGSVLVPAATPS